MIFKLEVFDDMKSNLVTFFYRGNFKTTAQAAKCRPRGRRAGTKACKHTLRPREEAIAERHAADWDESFETSSLFKTTDN